MMPFRFAILSMKTDSNMGSPEPKLHLGKLNERTNSFFEPYGPLT